MDEQERARDVLDELLQCESGLSEAEVNYIESMHNGRGVDWTKKQIAWLDKIYLKMY